MPSEQSEDLFNIVSQSGYQSINYRTLVHKEIDNEYWYLGTVWAQTCVKIHRGPFKTKEFAGNKKMISSGTIPEGIMAILILQAKK